MKLPLPTINLGRRGWWLIGVLWAVIIALFAHNYFVKKPTTTAPKNPPAPQSLVSFPNDQAKQDFLKSNNLNESDLKPSSDQNNTYVVPVPNNELKSADGTSVAPRREYKAMLTPNDPTYPQWYTNTIAAPTAWDISTGSSSVTIAIIDTGFALSHEDLSGRWAINSGESGSGKETNGIDDDGNGKIDDWRGWDFAQGDNNPIAGSTSSSGSSVNHGSITSGLLGATGNNSKGVASVNWGSKILPLQALSDNGSGFTEDVTAAVNYAVAQGAKVISMSLGSPDPDPTLETAINNAVAAGVTVVAAAGNCGNPGSCDTTGQMVYPGKYSNVIAVGATDQSDNRASFSSYGSELDIMAPGSGTITSTSWSQANQTALYGSASGTSISTPIVAGSAALLKGVLADLTPSEINTALTVSADKVAGMGTSTRTDQYGYGRLNSWGALKYLSTPHPDGILIYNSNHTGVLRVEGGKSRAIVSGSVFSNQGFDWSKIKEPDVADVRLTADTALSNFREGSLLESQGGIYAVDITALGAAEKRPFYSWDAFVGLGYSLDEVIKVLPSELPSADGTPITTANLHPDGTLIYNPSHTGIQIIDNGQLRNIPSGNVFGSYSFSWSRIKNPTTPDSVLPAISNLPFREGTLLLANGGIYVIDDNGGTSEKRAIGSWNTFVGLGYNLNEVLPVSVSELPSSSGTIINY